MGIKLAVVLGSGIEIDKEKVTDVNVLKENLNGIHHIIVFTCKFEGSEMLVISGRKHYYEGYGYEELSENINTVSELSIKNLIITNAAGGVNFGFAVGDLMLIRSHINLNTPLLFKKKCISYNNSLSEKFISACVESGVKIHEGVYGYHQGPIYETKAEIRFQKKYNIDAAGMSTIPEINRAGSDGIDAIGVSVITNLLRENAAHAAVHEEVLQNAQAASVNLNKAISVLLKDNLNP